MKISMAKLYKKYDKQIINAAALFGGLECLSHTLLNFEDFGIDWTEQEYKDFQDAQLVIFLEIKKSPDVDAIKKYEVCKKIHCFEIDFENYDNEWVFMMKWLKLNKNKIFKKLEKVNKVYEDLMSGG